MLGLSYLTHRSDKLERQRRLLEIRSYAVMRQHRRHNANVSAALANSPLLPLERKLGLTNFREIMPVSDPPTRQ